CEPVLATSVQASESQEFAMHFGDVRDRFRLLVLDGFRSDLDGRRIRTNGIKSSAHVYRALKSAIEQSQPGHVYVPYGNFLARTAALPFGLTRALRKADAEAETLLISGRYLQPPRGIAQSLRQRFLLELISRGPWENVFHLDDVAIEQFTNHGGRMAQLGKLMPDPHSETPTMDRIAAREQFGLPVDGRAIAVVGLIEKRKGLAALMQAMRDASTRLRPTDRLFLIGPQHPEAQAMLAGEFADLVAAGRVVMHDRRLSTDEIGHAIRAADVLATCYLHHPYTSSILIAAAAAERPVLGADTGWIGRTIDQFGLGHTCDPFVRESIADSLVASLDASQHYQPTEAGRRFVEFSTDRNYVAHWTARLRERIGLGPSPDLRTWQWALGGEGCLARAA
ncbi:MAG: hypothetical protein AAGF31_05695, partial [Planctomycetota bacterium]